MRRGVIIEIPEGCVYGRWNIEVCGLEFLFNINVWCDWWIVWVALFIWMDREVFELYDIWNQLWNMPWGMVQFLINNIQQDISSSV